MVISPIRIYTFLNLKDTFCYELIEPALYLRKQNVALYYTSV